MARYRKRVSRRFIRRKRRRTRYGNYNYFKAKFSAHFYSWWGSATQTADGFHEFATTTAGQSYVRVRDMLDGNAEYNRYAKVFSQMRITGVSVVAVPAIKKNQTTTLYSTVVLAPFFQSNDNNLVPDAANAVESDRGKVLDYSRNTYMYWGFPNTVWYRSDLSGIGDMQSGIMTGSNKKGKNADSPYWNFKVTVYARFRNRF